MQKYSTEGWFPSILSIATMSAQRRDKFQDSNALIQLSRQLQAKQLADSSVTAHNPPADPASTHQRSRHAANSKRQKLPDVISFNDGPVNKRRKTAAKSIPATLQPVAQIKASTTGQASEQTPPAEQVVNEAELDGQKPHTAVSPQSVIKELEPFDLVAWYSKICTHGFAAGLSALQQGHDSSHAHPRLIAKCITMNASLLEAKKDVVYQSWHSSPFQHASQRL